MATYKTPGVYIEEIPKLPPSIAEVETAIPAFIGYTKENNTGFTEITPVRITSLVEYVTLFGTAAPAKFTTSMTGNYGEPGVVNTLTVEAAQPQYTMYYQMQMYFANGGGPCYIVSVGTADENDIYPSNADLLDGLDAVSRFDEPTLLVFPDGVNLAIGDLTEVYKQALIQCGKLKDRFVIMDSGDDFDTFRDGVGTENLKYGAAYYPSLNTSLNYVYDEATFSIDLLDDDGVTSLSEAITLDALRSVNDNQYNLVKAAIDRQRITLNPSPAIAGVYAAVDSTRGVWKAPANVSLNYVSSLTDQVSDDEQNGLNVDPATGKSINVIRYFTGKGNLVWGARTLAGNDNEWRYISVRRFFNMVEESAKKAIEAFVFEANDANTWVKVQSMVENYLTTLWRAGALQGAKPEHAFYVAVGLGKTMTAQDVLEGRMYVEIGMAAVRPAEFIILRFSHMMAQS